LDNSCSILIQDEHDSQ